jgi:hypothetical protein
MHIPEFTILMRSANQADSLGLSFAHQDFTLKPNSAISMCDRYKNMGMMAVGIELLVQIKHFVRKQDLTLALS